MSFAVIEFSRKLSTVICAVGPLELWKSVAKNHKAIISLNCGS